MTSVLSTGVLVLVAAWVAVFVLLAALSLWLRRKRRGRRKEDRAAKVESNQDKLTDEMPAGWGEEKRG